MNIRQDRNLELLAQIGKDRECAIEPLPAHARKACPVRLVVRGLIDEADTKTHRHLLELACHHEGVVAAFELAWAGNQEERLVVADLKVAKLQGAGWCHSV